MRLLLGAKATSLSDIRLPAFCSYKVDGWRGIWQGLEFFTRNGKTIANRQLQRYAAQLDIPPGYDGEIIVGAPNDSQVFPRTDSFCKRMNGLSHNLPVRFFVFDHAGVSAPYWKRYDAIREIGGGFVIRLDQHLIERYDDLEAFEAKAVAEGYEGICARAPNGVYKQGRSTLREQYLVKLKRYIDEEVEIVDFEELQHNANPATISETGYAKRSSHQDGKVPGGILGALIVNWRDHLLRVGTGFTRADRTEFWGRREQIRGKRCTIRYSPPTKLLPRQPVFKGIRVDL